MYYRLAIAALVAGIATLLLTLLAVPEQFAGRGVAPADPALVEMQDRARLLVRLANQPSASGTEPVTNSARHLRRLLESSGKAELQDASRRLLDSENRLNAETLAFAADRIATLVDGERLTAETTREKNETLYRGALAVAGSLLALLGAAIAVAVTRRDRDELAACEMVLPPRPGALDSLSFRLLRLEHDRKQMARDLLSAIDSVGSLRMATVELSTQLQFDDLTGLYTARGLLDAIDPMIEAYLAEARPFVLVAIDLDLFKRVNSYGHKEGDRALVHFGDRLRSVLGDAGYGARPSGDEFLAVIAGQRAEATEMISRLRDVLRREPFLPDAEGAREITVNATYGYVSVERVGLLLDAGHSAADRRRQFSFLLHYADKALTYGKKLERGSVNEYDPDFDYALGTGTLPMGVGDSYSIVERNIHTTWDRLDARRQQLLANLLHRAARVLVPEADTHRSDDTDE